MSRTKAEREASRRDCWHAWVVARAMSRDIPLRLIGHGGMLLAEGEVTHRTPDPAQGGLVVRCAGRDVKLSSVAQIRRLAT